MRRILSVTVVLGLLTAVGCSSSSSPSKASRAMRHVPSYPAPSGQA